MSDDRATLAKMQAGVLRALVRDAAPPAAFGEGSLEHAQKVLANKRRRELALAAPMLTAALGDHFAELFEAFAQRCGYPHHGGPGADAANFARWLQAQGKLPRAAIREAAGLRAWHHGPVQRIRAGDARLWAFRLGSRVWMW